MVLLNVVHLTGDSRPLLHAINSLQQDVEKVMGFRLALADEQVSSDVQLLIVNDAISTPDGIKPLASEEEHEVYADHAPLTRW